MNKVYAMNSMVTEKGLRVVEFEGEKYGLLENPEVDFADMDAVAEAVKINEEIDIDGDAKVYFVKWEVKNNFENNFVYNDDNDFSDACDWKHPIEVKFANKWVQVDTVVVVDDIVTGKGNFALISDEYAAKVGDDWRTCNVYKIVNNKYVEIVDNVEDIKNDGYVSEMVTVD